MKKKNGRHAWHYRRMSAMRSAQIERTALPNPIVDSFASARRLRSHARVCWPQCLLMSPLMSTRWQFQSVSPFFAEYKLISRNLFGTCSSESAIGCVFFFCCSSLAQDFWFFFLIGELVAWVSVSQRGWWWSFIIIYYGNGKHSIHSMHPFYASAVVQNQLRLNWSDERALLHACTLKRFTCIAFINWALDASFFHYVFQTDSMSFMRRSESAVRSDAEMESWRTGLIHIAEHSN